MSTANKDLMALVSGSISTPVPNTLTPKVNILKFSDRKADRERETIM
jgi:hypothetical protein